MLLGKIKIICVWKGNSNSFPPKSQTVPFLMSSDLDSVISAVLDAMEKMDIKLRSHCCHLRS